MERIDIDLKVQRGEAWVCHDCGKIFLTKKQKGEMRVYTFHANTCILCSENKMVTHIRNYNWLYRSKNKVG